MTSGKSNNLHQNDINTSDSDFSNANVVSPTRSRTASKKAYMIAPTQHHHHNNDKRKSTTLPTATVEYLKAWMMSPEHVAHPYPTDQEKAKIMQDTGIELKQLTNWFVNNRKRYWKPRVEAQIQQQQSPVKSKNESKSANKASTSNSPHHTAAIQKSTSNPRTFIASPVGPIEQCSLSKIVSLGTVSAAVEEDSKSGSSSISSSVDGGYASSISTSMLQLREQLSLHNSNNVNKIDANLQPQTSSLLTDLSRVHSPFRAVSEQSSFASESSASSSSSEHDDEDEEEESLHNSFILSRTELVDVHVLRPSLSSLVSSEPTLEDVTILNNVPAERIMRSYNCCVLTYRYHANADKKKIQSKRDAEIVRLKKQILRLFLAESSAIEADTITASVPASPVQNKRKLAVSSETNSQTEEVVLSPRPKYRRISIDVWKEACLEAKNIYDDALPSLEEAMQLFGYAG